MQLFSFVSGLYRFSPCFQSGGLLHRAAYNGGYLSHRIRSRGFLVFSGPLGFYSISRKYKEGKKEMATQGGCCNIEPPMSMAASDALCHTGAPQSLPLNTSGAVRGPLLSEARLLIIAGPSGVGKGTLVKKLRSHWPAAFGFSVSHTTRQPRPGEVNGREYYFVGRGEIERMRDTGELLEYAEFSGNMYATSIGELRRISSLGQICLLEIDLVGVASVRAHAFPHAKFVFIEPPSFDELERRLRLRNTESQESMLKRMAHAEKELEGSKEFSWDLRLVNDSVEEAWRKLRDSIGAWFDLPAKQPSDLS